MGVKDECLRKLIDYIEHHGVFDTIDDDGDGHYDTSKSSDFETLLEDSKNLLNKEKE